MNSERRKVIAPMAGYQVIFDGTDYQVQRYPGRVVTHPLLLSDCESLEIAKTHCLLLSDWRRMLLDAVPPPDDRA